MLWQGPFENIKTDGNALKVLGKFIESSHFKYGIYKPREFENHIKKLVLAHLFLYQIFKLPWFINPILKMERLINSIYSSVAISLKYGQLIGSM